MSTLWSTHIDNMISEPLLRHYKIFRMEKPFAKTLSLFEKLTKEEISDIYLL